MNSMEIPTQYTKSWFVRNILLWKTLLVPLATYPIRALEIGVFEGMSTTWLQENVLTHPDSCSTWVDPFCFAREYETSDIDFPSVKERFLHNTERFASAGKLSGHVGKSGDVLRKLDAAKKFDLIYIDGSHEAADCLEDMVLAWPLLETNGLMGVDDYLWEMFPDEPTRHPALAIDAFLAVMSGRYREVHRGYQVWIQKL
jgi:predicted O-methyltransferase YrrM